MAPEGIACDLASLSPKLLNSAPDSRLAVTWRKKHESLRWQPAVVRAWLDRGAGDYQFKFVVAQPGDVDELEGMLASLKRDIPARQSPLDARRYSHWRQFARKRAGLVSCAGSAATVMPARLHIELYW